MGATELGNTRMRVTGWSKLFLDFVDGPAPKHIVTEAELLDLVVLSGRQVSDDWPRIILHAMRAIGWKLRQRDRAYRRKASRPTNGGAS